MKTKKCRSLECVRSRRTTSRIYTVGLIISIAALLSLTACYKEPCRGLDGRPGRAFLAVTWVDAQPDLINSGNSAIPPVFDYGRFYLSYPGLYRFYYEGRIWTGYAYASYAWEIDYEIWFHVGEPGGYGYNGADGPDNYFTMECSPAGPYLYMGAYYKSDSVALKIIEQSDEGGIMELKGETHTMRMTYRKVR
ncbi:MAG: hypothetical protein U9R60_11270 [Bacteroidota bacterium]|nr:hypothetical protein [Bacteroidota bacterium]